MEQEIILEDWSPVCNIQAFVEKTEKTYYFYLWENPEGAEPQIKTCWICNRVEAPKEIDMSEFGEGQAPRMPAEFVNHAQGGIELQEEALRIVWFEEGDAAALLEGDKILAVIPCFSGYKNFHGYSVYADGAGPFAWELKQAYEHFKEKVAECDAAWAFFDTEYWGEVQKSHLRSLEEFFGPHEKYFAIDGGKFPPKALLTGNRDGVFYGITAGVSMIPMPKVEMTYQDQYREYRRTELGFACTQEKLGIANAMLGMVSGLSGFPWGELTFLGHGHTIPISHIEGYQYILFLNAAELPEKPIPKYDAWKGERVNLLWLKPITAEEYQVVCNQGVEAYLAQKKEKDVHIVKE